MRMLMVLLGVLTLFGNAQGQAPAVAAKPKVFRGFDVVRVDRFAVGVWKDNAFTFIYSKDMTPEERNTFGVLPPEEAKVFQEQYERIQANQQAQVKVVTQEAARPKTGEPAMVLEIAAFTEEKGKAMPILAAMTKPLGLGDQPIPSKGVGYRVEGSNSMRFFFVATHEGKRIMIVSTHNRDREESVHFLANGDGAVAKCLVGKKGEGTLVRDPEEADKALASALIAELHGKLKRGELQVKQ